MYCPPSLRSRILQNLWRSVVGHPALWCTLGTAQRSLPSGGRFPPGEWGLFLGAKALPAASLLFSDSSAQRTILFLVRVEVTYRLGQPCPGGSHRCASHPSLEVTIILNFGWIILLFFFSILQVCIPQSSTSLFFLLKMLFAVVLVF